MLRLSLVNDILTFLQNNTLTLIFFTYLYCKRAPKKKKVSEKSIFPQTHKTKMPLSLNVKHGSVDSTCIY